jgi:hypothetical protein
LELFEFLNEADRLVQLHPQIPKRINADLDLHDKNKKVLRLETDVVLRAGNAPSSRYRVSRHEAREPDRWPRGFG